MAPGAARMLLATALPMALLAAAAACALLARGIGTPPPGFAIARSPIAAARAEHAARGLRHVVLAERFESGVWPSSLEGLSAARGPMAALGGRPYYHASRTDGAVLLAPER